jgi:hypothetical protein
MRGGLSRSRRAIGDRAAVFAIEINGPLCNALTRGFTPAAADLAATFCRNVLEGRFPDVGAT